MENSSTSGTGSSQPVRPVFLAVICILTFIGSGWGIIQGCMGYLTANTAAAIVKTATEDAQKKLEENGQSNSAINLSEKLVSGLQETYKPENLRKHALFQIGSCFLTLFGAIMMYRLRKSGFWLYIAGTAVGVIGPFAAFGATNLLGIFATSWIAFVGILFVILYSLNLKYLK